MSNKAFIAIPKSLFEDNNLSHQERIKRVEELVEKQLLHDEFKSISPKMSATSRSPKKEFFAIPKLKFRAWFKQGSKMVNVATIDFLEKEVKSHANVMYSFDEIELMQSTGLFDMYDKEIFNGDVLKTYDGELAKVVWNKYLGCWEAKFLSEIVDLSEVVDVKSNRSDCEVVGNIYENPEFLEEEE